MIKFSLTLGLAMAVLAAPAFAGDAEKGKKEFNKCKACHSITDAAGTDVVKGGKTGPNLFGVIGRAVASYPEFKYSDAILAVGANGTVWDEAMLAAYAKDPSVWLVEQTGDAAAKSAMTFKMAKGGEDVAAYLATFK